MLPPLIDQE
jgi:hypothetical protein